MENYNPFSLAGKTILVTGASSGIGRSIAIECSKMGATVIITARSKERLEQTRQLMIGDGHKIIVADIMNDEQMRCLVAEMPPINGLVNCAGYIRTLPAKFIDKEELSNMMNVNFIGPTILTTILVKSKKILNGSSIVFISSISGTYCSAPANSMYSASKSAIDGMVKGLAVDLAPKSIRVNSVNPGMVETNIMENSSVSQEQLREDMKHYPLKRYGKPEEVAYAVVFLLSETSTWITGTDIVIDGGRTSLY